MRAAERLKLVMVHELSKLLLLLLQNEFLLLLLKTQLQCSLRIKIAR
jgi:hypothetical protein